ncbi:Pkinase domain-containing protein/LRR_1 domain-containing protein/LRR_4 domain-containing protein/LRR_7 domain-containing protein/LRR_6 domain-containing protein/LRR_8 domain-containing protein [Cephalotus follicularis]|uniref:non-specific serine/threonine protein kinase n=1 Tax=Cephalotus follicularis TaxID=3775 RepID=A0A1Q3D9U1_CEPFO|nr:Pkinase domain-containing protein/LRR_1 domain-containing protein/LRR_4 domain-containing protein/LRR_7 domain-containing protein/LRR_6 domain-containing protein/LRR_8 domain-containing protein [Cephalotus follicularis]
MKPHFLFFLTFSFCSLLIKTSLVFSATTLPLQLISLLSLKSSLKDPLSTFHDWDPTPAFTKSNLQDPVWCSWSGLKCNTQTAQISSLDLSHRNLSGIIPDEIKYLSGLIHLNLSGNAFDGPLQAAIFDLTELRTLDISHNSFNSTFPPGISKLKFLRILNVYSNSLTGPLPQEFDRLHYLEQLNLGGSYFEGEIPVSYGRIPRLKFLDLAGNSLQGPVPPQLGFLGQLERMEIGYNQFTGRVPVEFSLLSNLNYIDISNCQLSGSLPEEIGNLTKLENLLLFKNHFTGEIPVRYTNLRNLKALDLSDNQLSGTIPEGITSLTELTRISLMNNILIGEVPQGIGELPNLDTLLLWNNSLSGILPQKLGSNGKLQHLDVSSNSLTGPIPANLCRGMRLFKLILFSNKFTSGLPASLANCTSLSRFRIQNNYLNDSIPYGFGLLPNLSFVDLSNNNFSGEIPSDLSNAPRLEYLNISGNSFKTTLPTSIWSAPNLQIFSASSSKIIGKIPDFIGCRSLYKLELQGNSLNGSIPWDISHCEKLLCLNLSLNSLTGIIPWEISTLNSITDIDLSHNFLTGTIPSNFDNCSTLENFNVSYNLLTGPIPVSGSIFPNLHPSSFSGNEGLCGEVLAKPCAADTSSTDNVEVHRQQQPKKTAGAIVWIMAAAFGIGLFVLVAGTRCFHANYGRRFNDEREIGPWKLTAFQRLNFTADDVVECLSMTDKIIGMGSTGTVYKAEMAGGEIIAVKKLWSKNKENIRRRRGVLAEVEVLGNVRHRNIVRLLGCCSNRECTMLLYEYMPNGNLDDLLHGKNKGENLVADWVIRYKIALGVAQGICYLHHDCDPVIVHRDLKPSNILLDGEMEARVADFGVAKLIQSDESMSVIAGSYGYIAPEYAYTLQVDEKSDIYSYGVVLMEIISGKKSVDAEFGDGNSIVDWVKSKIKIKNGVTDILDKNAGASIPTVREEMMQMLRIALLCTSRNPADRPSMRDVVLMLQEAKPKRKLPRSVVVRVGGEEDVVNVGGGGADVSIIAQKPILEC